MASTEDQLAKAEPVGPWRSKTVRNLQSNNVANAHSIEPHANASAGIDFARTRSDPMDIGWPSDVSARQGNNYTGFAPDVDHYYAHAEDSNVDTLAAQQDLFILQAEQHRLQTGYEAQTEGPTYASGEQQHLTNIYITDLPKDAGDDTLYALGSACGTVISHKAMLDGRTGICKGFGFLMYATHDEARHAIQWLGAHGFTSSFAKESFSARLRRMEDSSSTNVYLSNLPIKYTDRHLEQLFAPHPIASLKILQDVNGDSRGVGFVRLMDRSTAQRCIQRLHGRILPGTTQPLQVRFADSEAQKSLKKIAHQKQTLDSLTVLRNGPATYDGKRILQPSTGTLAASKDSLRTTSTAMLPQYHPDNFLSDNNMYATDGKQAGHDPVGGRHLGMQGGFPGGHLSDFCPYPAFSPFAGHGSLPAPNPSFFDPMNQVALPQMDHLRQAELGYGKPAQAAGVYPRDFHSSPMARMYSNSATTAPLWSTMPMFPNALFPALPLPVDFGRYEPSQALYSRWNPVMQNQLHSQGRILSNGQSVYRGMEHGVGQGSLSAPLRASMPRVGMPRPQTNASLRAVSDPLSTRSTRDNRFGDMMGLPTRRRAAVSADNSIDEGQGSVQEAHEDDLDYGSSSSIEFQL